MDLLLRTANLTTLFTTWHGALSQMNPILNRFTLSQSPQEFTRQQPKIFHRPRSQDNTPGRQFSLKLTKTHLRRFYEIRIYARKMHSKRTVYGQLFIRSLDRVWTEWKTPRSRSKVEKTERSISICTPYTYSVPTASIVRS